MQWFLQLTPDWLQDMFVGLDAAAGPERRTRRLTEVNWFVRANELSPVNQGLMGYPGTANLVRELERFSPNVRHT